MAHSCNTLRPVMAGTVDQAAHGVGHHPRRRTGLEHGQRFLESCRGCDPRGHLLLFEDHRHPIMNGLHQSIGHGGEDGRGFQHLSLLALPVVPYPGKGKELIGRRMHEIGLLACALAAPLIEPTCQDDAATVAHRTPKGGLGLICRTWES